MNPKTVSETTVRRSLYGMFAGGLLGGIGELCLCGVRVSGLEPLRQRGEVRGGPVQRRPGPPGLVAGEQHDQHHEADDNKKDASERDRSPAPST